MVVQNGARVGGISNHPELSISGGVSSFGEDTQGEMYISGFNGQVYRIEQ